MAHELESMFYARHMDGGIPWHGLGTPVNGNLASADALHRAGLNWDVALQRVFIRDMRNAAERTAIEIPDVRAVVRSDTSAALATVTTRYKPIQNRDMLATFADAVGDAAVWHTAGSLQGGRQVWGLAEIPGDWKVAGLQHRRFVLAAGGHDGQHTVRFLPTDITVVCANTLGAALSGQKKSGYTVRHIGDVASSLRTVRDAFAATFEQFAGFKTRMEALHDVSLPRTQARDLMTDIVRNGRTTDDGRPVELGSRDQSCVDTVLRLERNGKGAETWSGTAYGLLQAVADYVDHERMQDGTPEKRFLYQTDGAGASLKARTELVLISEFCPGLLDGPAKVHVAA
jgi:phage/plasmid-like protein (TIGR03299 family)